jgi:leucyl-tRNA synthetase
MALDAVRSEKVEMKALLRDVEKKLGLRLHTVDLAKFLQEAIQEFRAMSEEQLAELAEVELDEFQVLFDAAGFLAKQFGAEVKIFRAGDIARYDPQNRAPLSKPMRPAIYVE